MVWHDAAYNSGFSSFRKGSTETTKRPQWKWSRVSCVISLLTDRNRNVSALAISFSSEWFLFPFHIWSWHNSCNLVTAVERMKKALMSLYQSFGYPFISDNTHTFARLWTYSSANVRAFISIPVCTHTTNAHIEGASIEGCPCTAHTAM